MSRADTARAYYRAIDEGRYADLRELLTPGFVHDRPDQTLHGRERFVSFMREERPDPDTRHEVAVVSVGTHAVVEGRLVDADDGVVFRFADSFRFEDDGGRVTRLVTYTNSRPEP